MANKDPPPVLPISTPPTRRSPRRKPTVLALCALATTLAVYNTYLTSTVSTSNSTVQVQHIPLNAQQILGQCAALRATVGPSIDFLERQRSDRFEPGTPPILIRNATIWTGARNGTETVRGDLYLEQGIVKGIGYVSQSLYAHVESLVEVNAQGGWVTPGLVDLHSHLGIFSTPVLSGAYDVNSAHGPILPWLRSIDAFNTHDESIRLAIAGGVTSAQILPGSGNAIGGQAFMVKLRPTSERSPTSMMIEPPYTLNGTEFDPSQPLRWRHLKSACGENLRRYGNRMDAVWSFRSAYNEARKIKNTQDAYCAKVEAGLWNELQGQDYPDNLQWEALVDVLRGRVKISNHCYEEVDLDDIVRLTNEFQFPIASFHHASEAWLVPDVLKRTWGGTPTIAMFATKHRYKRESYRGSEFAARVLADNGIPVVMKSDHPVLNSRYLMFEAQQAHYFGLPQRLALGSVTSVPAAAAGMSHRIGILYEGADADVVLWDSHPLQLGATPRKVWIDGILQIGNDKEGVIVGKGKEDRAFQDVPDVPNWDAERENAIKYEGLPPLEGMREGGRVVFRNVRELWLRGQESIVPMFMATASEVGTEVVVENGKVSCIGRACMGGIDNARAFVDLRGGSISPSLMTFGSRVGLEEISGEPSTGDGAIYDPYSDDVPAILGDKAGLVRASDALQFGTRNALLANRAGVSYATSSLIAHESTISTASASINVGLSTTFRTGATHGLERGAVIKHVTALHVVISRSAPTSRIAGVSVSSQIATLRRLLLNAERSDTETGHWFKQAAKGVIPLVIDVASADIMVTLLKLKAQIEEERGSTLRMVFARATEAHLIASEIAQAKVGVILDPVRPFPQIWDERRILPGPPLTNDTELVTLMEHGVTVGIGVHGAWEAANTRFEAAWAGLESNGRIDRLQAHALVSTNLEKLLDLEGWLGDDGDLVAYAGGSAFDLSSKVTAVLSPGRGLVELF
ncbi:predicted protein [Sparassis crispa]|uniref:Amidohydrolase-related domain-containing protein n=1 Tax=Sparassis crispa TaxID=139825 RepID=A0A401GDG8_9APHY|nr:predicted protein [Sparassis crispa]GBE80175.1 predicted protein [Sparassis crispa]